eukprot:2722344-Rhodomonas_salina.1
MGWWRRERERMQRSRVTATKDSSCPIATCTTLCHAEKPSKIRQLSPSVTRLMLSRTARRWAPPHTLLNGTLLSLV